MQRLSKRAFWILALLLLVLGGVGYSLWHKREAKQELEHELVAATRGNIEDIVTAQGKLEPKDYVDVGVQVSGQLKRLYVEIGDVVKQGDLLAELDPQSYQSKVDGDLAKIKSLQAQLVQQQAQADFDRLQFARADKLVKSGAISREEVETREKALKVSEAAVESLLAQIGEAQAGLETDQINLGYTKIYAPMEGVVSDQIAREGQTLNANQTTPTVVQVANLDVMTVRAQIAEADVQRLRPGMESEFSTLGSLERKWRGTIRQILPTPEVINDVVLYNALIDVDNKDRQLMNGMSTQNSFVIDRAENVLLLPTRALGRRLKDKDEQTGRAYQVQIVLNGQRQDRVVWVGLVTRAAAEIRRGLSEGDQVVLTMGSGGEGRAPGVSTGKPRLPVGPRL